VAASSIVEREAKFEVSATQALPSLTGIAGVAELAAGVVDLSAVYFDTSDLALVRAGVTLRRRVGGDDEGWHLKLPSGRDREEFALALTEAATPPEEFKTLVQAQARGRQLDPVATLRTERIVHRLVDDKAQVVAEVSDDSVRAETPQPDGSVTVVQWREWEVELVAGPDTLLKKVSAVLQEAGGKPGSSPSKLARALGERLAAPQDLVERKPSIKGPAGVVLLHHLRGLIQELVLKDPQVRLDRPDAVHKMRVATRRLRSTLRTFRPFLHRATADRLRRELKWLAGVLGEARDAEVMRDRLTSLARREPDEIHADPVADQIGRELGEQCARGHEHVLAALESRRYFALLDSLDALAAAPPWKGRAKRPARKVLPERARRELTSVRRAATAAEKATGPAQRDELLHEVRKSAKRLRYACETLTPVFGEPANRLARAAKELQDVLGEHQDSIVSQQLLRDLAADSDLSGAAAIIYGRLHLLEQRHADHARHRYAAALNKVTAKRLARWMKG